mgnify:CR=1 FL=1
MLGAGKILQRILIERIMAAARDCRLTMDNPWLNR